MSIDCEKAKELDQGCCNASHMSLHQQLLHEPVRINKPELPKTAPGFGMLIASRCLAATYLGCIAQHYTRRCAQFDCKRRGAVRSLPYIVRSMSDEGQAAQKSIASGYSCTTLRGPVCMHTPDVSKSTLRRAPGKAEQGEETLFDKIVSKKIPATILYEDETALAFK